MIRKLALAISLVGALGTSAAQALGLGEAKVASNLNQPLNAEIDLVSTAGLSTNEIIANFASREDFSRLGVDRPQFLADVRFKVEKNAQGKLVLRLSSSKPVKEPYLNFLVEVVWPSGRLLREYALLIDPPVFAKAVVEPVSAPVVQQQSASSVPSKKPAPVIASTPASASATPAVVSSGGDTYGPTDANDTLWDIALKARPDVSVSPQQTMLAIQDLNGSAFIDENINKLKRGQVLRLPNRDQINSRTRQQAVREVVAQNKALAQKSPEARTIDATAQKPSMPSTAPATGDSLKIVVDQAAAPVADGSHGGEGGTSGGTVTQLQNKLTVTEESLDATKRENTELTGRVRDLESQIENLQRLITLKNDELAGIQGQASKTEATAEAATDVAAPATTETAAPESPFVAPEATAPEAAAVAEPAVTETVATETVVAETGTVEGGPDAVASETQTTDVVAVETPVVETPVVKTPAIAATPAPEADVPFMDRIFTDPMYQLGAGGGLIALIALLWAISRRNAKKESEYFEKVAFEAATVDDSSDDSATPDLTRGDSGHAGGTEAGDALAEAEVYIAYGRLDQASHVLEAAVSKEPSRTDLRLKLLEVYADDQNSSAFERQFDELRAFDDDSAIADAEALRARFDSVPSIDDLESQLLAPTKAKPSLAELEAEEEKERQARAQADESSELDAIEFDLGGDTALPEALDDDLSALELDTDFSSLNIDGDDKPVAAADAELELDEFNLDLDDSADSLLTAVEALEDEVSGAEQTLGQSPEALGELEADLESTMDSLGGELDESFLNDLDAELEKVGSDDDELSALEASLDMPELELSEELTDDFMASGETAKPAPIAAPADELDDLDLGDALGEAPPDIEAADIEDMDKALAAVDEDLNDLEYSLDESAAADLASSADDELLALNDDDLSEAEMELAAEPVDESEAEDFDFLAGADEAATKLDLARAYIDMGDTDGARDILEEVTVEGNSQQKSEAQKLLDSIG